MITYSNFIANIVELKNVKVIHRSLTINKDYKLLDIFNALNEHFVRGILTDKGRILWDEYKSYPTKN